MYKPSLNNDISTSVRITRKPEYAGPFTLQKLRGREEATLTIVHISTQNAPHLTIFELENQKSFWGKHTPLPKCSPIGERPGETVPSVQLFCV